MSVNELVNLAAAMVGAFVKAGKVKPVLPEGRREEVVSTLTLLMADPDALETYAAALEDERRRGREVEMQLLGMSGIDIPDARIAAQGFAALSDDELADIALSPEAIHALREYLDDPETGCGAWLIDKILEVESARPDAEQRARRAQEIYDDLRARGLLG